MSNFIRAEEYCVAVKDGTHNSPKKTENGVKLATSKNIIGGNLDLSTAYFISEEDANEVNKRSKVDKNDILISMIGTVGEVCLIKDDPDFVIKNVGLLKNKCAYKAKWLYFYLKTNQAQNLIKERLRGTTQQYLSLGELRNFPVLLPKNEDHLKNAVNILWELEQKIQLNTQINQTLEQIAQTIFKSWFIDFDPVHTKANALASGQTAEQATQAAMAVISGKNTQELQRLQTANPEQYQQLWEIAEAFPSGFDEEGVPRGWGLSTIDENYNVVMGQSPKGETYNEERNGVLFYQGRAEFGWRYPEPRLYTTDPKRMAKKGNILMSVRAPVGDLNVALEDCCIGRGLAALSHKSNSLSFGLYQIKNLQNEFDIFNGEGTVFGSINQKDLKAIKVINPSFKIIKLFDDVCSSNELQIENLSREIIFLRKIRDELLPKLLSGEVVV